MSAGPAPSTPSMDRIDARVTALESTSNRILEKLDSLGGKIENNGKPQWVIILSSLTFTTMLLGYVGTSWKAPMETTLIRQEADIRALQAAVVPRAEHAEKQRQTDEMLGAMRDRVTRDLTFERNATTEGEKRLAERIERLENRVLFKEGVPGKRTELTRGPLQ